MAGGGDSDCSSGRTPLQTANTAFSLCWHAALPSEPADNRLTCKGFPLSLESATSSWALLIGDMSTVNGLPLHKGAVWLGRGAVTPAAAVTLS